ncbi:MAG: hypothetical protein Q8O28_09780 [Smithellaceae bacterium]|nr:hypothetical protein [Smithellaceae bacterium]
MQEILIVAAIGAAIFFLPRLMGRKSSSEVEQQPRTQTRPQPQSNNRVFKINLTGRIRLAILVTILWIAGCTAFLKPWEGNKFLYFCMTLGPTLVFWGGVWVWFGYKKYRR